MFSIFKLQKDFRAFHNILESAHAAPPGSAESISACEHALSLLKDSHKWPSTQQAYKNYYEGLLIKMHSQSVLQNPCTSEQILEVLERWEHAYYLMRSNNYEDNWIECAVHLSGEYFKQRGLNPEKFTERAIELVLSCKEALKAHPTKRFEMAIVCASLGECYADRTLGDKDDNIEFALQQIRQAQSLINIKSHPVDWAMFRATEANLLKQYERGDRVQNVSDALSACEQADNILRREGDLENLSINAGNWAMLLVGSPLGNRKDNLEQALKLMESTRGHRDNFHTATDLINMSSIYSLRIKGDRAENLNTSYKYATRARNIFVQENNQADANKCTVQIAQIQLSRYKELTDVNIEDIEQLLLAVCAEYRSKNDYEGIVKVTNVLAEYYAVTPPTEIDSNINKSIAVMRSALSLSDKIRKVDRVILEQNLANYLLELNVDRGGSAFNEAVNIYKKGLDYALSVNDTEQIISARMNLASVLSSATRNTQIHDQELGIALLQANLEESMVINDKKRFAQMVIHLGNIYSQRVVGYNDINNQIALNYYFFAIETCPAELDLVTWANATINFASEILNIDAGQSEESLATALEYIEQVISRLEEHLHTKMLNGARLVKASILMDMADSNINGGLGNATSYLTELLHDFNHPSDLTLQAQVNRKLGQLYLQQKPKLRDNQQRIEGHLQKALAILTPDGHPEEWFQITVMLASMYASIEKWQLADEFYQKAFATHQEKLSISADNLMAKSILNLGRWSTQMAPFCALMRGDIKRALEYNEMLRTRELLGQSLRQIHNQSDEGDAPYNYDNIRQMMEKSIGHFWGRDRGELLMKFDQIYPNPPDDAELQGLGTTTDPTDLDQLLSMSMHWLFVPFLSENSARFILIPPKVSTERAIVSPMFSLGSSDVFDFAVKISEEGQSDSFLSAIYEYKYSPHGLEQNALPLLEQIDNLAGFLTKFIGDWLFQELDKAGAPKGASLCIVSERYLSSLPLGLSKHPEAVGVTLDEQYSLSFSTSITSLIACNMRAEKTTDVRLALIPGHQNNGLVNTNLEFDFICQSLLADCVHRETYSGNKDSVRQTLSQANHWHFTTHGDFDRLKPASSGLELADRSKLEIHQMSYLVSETSLRLAVLSACESGVIDMLDPSNDFLGMPSALLKVGAAGVVATLWPVDDSFSAIFMARFYHELVQEINQPAEALRRTKIWIKKSTANEAIDFLTSLTSTWDDKPFDQHLLYMSLAESPADAKPFEHPIFWGGYVLYGT